jgi:hypothetical protein
MKFTVRIWNMLNIAVAKFGLTWCSSLFVLLICSCRQSCEVSTAVFVAATAYNWETSSVDADGYALHIGGNKCSYDFI